jgi:TfoX N-terminal domain
MTNSNESLYTLAIHMELLEDALAHAGLSPTLQKMKMLGGTGLSVKGHFIALIHAQGAALRLSPNDQLHLLTLPGARRLEFPGDAGRNNQWVLVPERMVDEVQHYASWIKKAWKFTQDSVPQERTGKYKPGRMSVAKALKKKKK